MFETANAARIGRGIANLIRCSNNRGRGLVQRVLCVVFAAHDCCRLLDGGEATQRTLFVGRLPHK